MDDDEKKHEPGTSFTCTSGWTLGSEADSDYFFGSDRESSILSEFGWNLRPDTDRNLESESFSPFYQIDLDGCSDLAGTSIPHIPQNTPPPPPAAAPGSSQTVSAGSVDKSGDASPSNPSVSSSSTDEPQEKSTASEEKPPETP